MKACPEACFEATRKLASDEGDMKILIVTSSFPRWTGDPAGIFLLHLGKALTNLGHDITVLAPHAPHIPVREEMEGIEVHRFRYAWPGRLQTLAYGEGMAINVRKNPMRFFLLLPYIISQGIAMRRLAKGKDLVNVHWLLPQGLVAGLFRVRSVVTVHGSDVNLGLGIPGRILLRFSLKSALAVTANSRATRRTIEEKVPGVVVSIIPMGVDMASFEDADFKPHEVIDMKGPRIICVGRLIPLKGQRYLIDALPMIKGRFPGATVTLVGDGPERGNLIALCKRLGIYDSVDFKGMVSTEKLPGILREHDIFVLPSVIMPSGETEGLGTVILEAMAVGLPVVGTNVGGIPDMIEDGVNGILVKERSPDAIFDAVSIIAGDDELRNRFVKRAKKFVKDKFSWKVVARDFDSLFKEISG